MSRPEHLRWLKAHGHDLAPLTGTDARALAAIAACWQLYAVERCANAIEAAGHLVLTMQPKTRPLAKALIPWALDWSDEEPVWLRVLLAIDARRS